MKKYLILLFLASLLISCESVIDVPLDTANPKLVIDANILWQKNTIGNEQKIKLTTTTNYYNQTIPTVSGALVSIKNSNNSIFNFVETVTNSGEYICTSFVPTLNETYTLTVVYNGESYNSTEKLLATPNIDTVQQNSVQGFGGDEIQVKFFYQDNGLENNFYFIGVKNSVLSIPEYGVLKDEFFQGNTMFGFYTTPELKSGDQLFFTLEGITEKYFNYMNKLINIAGSQNGSPFATPPATLRGNIINQNNDSNYPLGYFHLSEVDSKNYIVQ